MVAKPQPLFKVTNELRTLVEGFCNETLSEPESGRLNKLLHEGAEARSFYLAYLAIHAGLAREFGSRLPAESVDVFSGLADEPAAEARYSIPKRLRSRRSRRLWITAGSAAAAAVLLACLFLASWKPKVVEAPQPPSDSPVAGARLEQVATLSGCHAAQWADPGHSVEVGEKLSPGRLNLLSGIVEITFADGAVVLLEGPGEFEVLGASRGFLHHGQAVVRISRQARGFVLATRDVDILDLGTEFAVRVERSGKTEIQVLEGNVVAQMSNTDEGAIVKRPIEAGEAIAVDARADLPVQEIPYAPERYVRELPVKKSLVLHYAFDKDEGERVRDISNAENHGKSHGTKWTAAGRGPRNGACEFDGEESFINAGAAPTLKMTDQVTIAAWLLPVTFENSRNPRNFRNVLSDHGTSENNGKILRLQGNRLEYLMGPEGSPEVGVELSAAGKWCHAVATFDGAAMRLYIDGAQVAARPHLGEIPLNRGPILIGKSGFDEYFHGLLDDVMLYNRAMSEKEVKELYRAQGGK